MPGIADEVERDEEHGYVVCEVTVTAADGSATEVLIDASDASVLAQQAEDADEADDADETGAQTQNQPVENGVEDPSN